MRIVNFALVAALAYAQQDGGAGEEEIDYDADWTAGVQWDDVKTVDGSKSKKFNTSNDTNPAWTGLPTSVTVKTADDGSKSVVLSVRSGWDVQWQDSKNAKCCTGSYGAVGWAWQNADGNWETATQGATRGDQLDFQALQQGMSSDVSSPDLSREGVQAWGNSMDGTVDAWSVVSTRGDVQRGNKVSQIAGLEVVAQRPMTNDGVTSTISFQNLESYKICAAGYINRQGEVGWSETGCASFTFNMPVKPEPEALMPIPLKDEDDFASKLTASAFAVAALFALNF